METSSSSSWGTQNLRKYPCTAESAELRRPAVPDYSSYQKSFDLGRSMLVCLKCKNKNTFVRNGNTKAGPAIKCNNSSCRHRIASKSFFSFVNPLLRAAHALADSNRSAGPRPTAVAITSTAQPTSEQHITVIQVPKQQWDALVKRCTTLEDQVARLSERLGSANDQTVPSNRQKKPCNRQATLPEPARYGGAQSQALLGNEAPALPSGIRQVSPSKAPSANRSWADIARSRTKLSLHELPVAYKSKLVKVKRLLRDAGYSSPSRPTNSPPPMEARYFSGF